MGYESSRGFGPSNRARENARMADLQEQQRLRNFAARVTDEAHFQRILDDTQPGYRDAVESALRPWLRFAPPTEQRPDPFSSKHNYDTPANEETP